MQRQIEKAKRASTRKPAEYYNVKFVVLTQNLTCHSEGTFLRTGHKAYTRVDSSA